MRRHITFKSTCVLLTHLMTIASVSNQARAGTPADEAYRSHIGQLSQYSLGMSVAGVGDINNDGVEDYIVGALNDAPGDPGKAYVYSGYDGSVIRSFAGEASVDTFGMSVAGAGDVNNDGVPDLIVGAPTHVVETGPNSMTIGRAYVFSGHIGPPLHLFEAQDIELMGFSVASAGDVNGDGHDDLIVGSPVANLSGKACVYSGATGQLLYTFTGQNLELAGAAVAGLGDLNGDGYDEIAVGAPNRRRVYVVDVYNGVVIRTLIGPNGSRFGASVSSAGDVDDDGVNDVIIGAPQAAKAYVYSGATGAIIYNFAGGSGTNYGTSVAGGRDVNDDGVPDFVIGAPQFRSPTNTGRVEVRSGATGDLIKAMRGYAEDHDFGYSVAMIGDVNGDDLDDVLVGAPQFRLPNSPKVGAAWVYCDFINQSELNSQQQRGAGAGAGGVLAVDLNGDSWMDFVTVNPKTNKLKVFLNQGGTYVASGTYSPGLGPSAVAAGDFDKDGDLDLVVTLRKQYKVVFYANNGAGGLIKQGKLKTGKQPVGVVAADFNLDDRTDFAVTNFKSNNVWVFRSSLSNASALHKRFHAPFKYYVGQQPTQIHTGRFNNDAKPDLAVLVGGSKKVCVLLNSGGATFNTKKYTSVPAQTTDLVVARFNDDWRDDIAYVGGSGNNVYVRLGGFNGAFGQQVAYAVGAAPRSVAAVDMNADGFPDLVTANKNAGTVSVLYNNHYGLFNPAMHFDAPGAPRFLHSADVDLDEDPDILSLDQTTGKVTVLENYWFD